MVRERGVDRRLSNFEKTFIITLTALFSFVMLGILFDNFSDDINFSPRQLSGGTSVKSVGGGSNIPIQRIPHFSYVVSSPGYTSLVGTGYGKIDAYSASGQKVWSALGDVSGGFGTSTFVTGDMNFDGYNDVLVGAPGFDGAAGSNIGKVYVLSGKNGAVLFGVEGTITNQEFGSDVSNAGDVNGDGVSDIIVGAFDYRHPTFGIGVGRAYVFDGSDGSLLWFKEGENWQDHFGWSVAGLGDINGNGRDDIIIGAQGWPGSGLMGKVYVYDGDGTSIWTMDAQVIGSQIGQGQFYAGEFGRSISNMGDINDDGINDIVVGAPGFSGYPGWAFVLSGVDGSLLWDQQELAGGNFGYVVSDAGDVTGDGYNDIAVSNPLFDGAVGANNGIMYIFDVKNSASLSNNGLLWSVEGENAGDGQPSSDTGFISGVRDLNGDGRSEVIKGTRRHDSNGLTNNGKTYVYNGFDGTLLFSVEGVNSHDLLGRSVSGRLS